MVGVKENNVWLSTHTWNLSLSFLYVYKNFNYIKVMPLHLHISMEKWERSSLPFEIFTDICVCVWVYLYWKCYKLTTTWPTLLSTACWDAFKYVSFTLHSSQYSHFFFIWSGFCSHLTISIWWRKLLLLKKCYFEVVRIR